MRYLIVLLLAGCEAEGVGRYQMAWPGGAHAMRLDTKTGVIERCVVSRAEAVCGVQPEDDVEVSRRRP